MARELGNAAYERGAFGEAVLAYQQGLSLPDLAEEMRTDLLSNLAVAQLKLGDARAAAETCTTASLLDPTNVRVLRTAVKAYQQLGELSSARDAKLALRAAQARAAEEPASAEARAAPAPPRLAYTGHSPESDAAAVTASMDELGDSLGPKLEALISGVDRWAARLEQAAGGQPRPLARLDELEPNGSAAAVAVCVCLEAVALTAQPPHAAPDAATAPPEAAGLNAALLRACGLEAAAGAREEEPAADDAREAELRRRVAEGLRLPAEQAAEAAGALCGVRLSRAFAQWCEEAASSEWQVAVLSASLKPLVRTLLRQAGLGHVTALAADALCRSGDEAGPAQWEVGGWSPTDRVRALRGWLSSSARGERGAPTAPHLVLVGAAAQDALLLRAEPPLVRTLYAVEASPLARWCEVNGVGFRPFRGFDALRADLLAVSGS